MALSEDWMRNLFVSIFGFSLEYALCGKKKGLFLGKHKIEHISTIILNYCNNFEICGFYNVFGRLGSILCLPKNKPFFFPQRAYSRLNPNMERYGQSRRQSRE
jgi:hypothetical protein